MNETPPIIPIILILLLCLVIKYVGGTLSNKLSDKSKNTQARKRNAETPDKESHLSDRYSKR